MHNKSKLNKSKSTTYETKKVSIIIPCFNASKEISKTLGTVEKQTYKNIEIICINDGSMDSTLEKLVEYKNNSSFLVKIINQKNQGVSVSRNVGIEESRGEYLLFLDSDDRIHPDFVKSLIEPIQNRSVDISYCRLTRSSTEFGNNNGVSKPVVQNINKAMEHLLYEMGTYGFTCYIYSKEIIKKEQLFFDENTKYGEDREFVWKYLAHCKTAAWVDSPLYLYTVNPSSATNTVSWRKTDLLEAVKRTEKYLENLNIEFSEEFNSYMFDRSMWAVAKTFSLGKSKKLFNKLRKEYNVKDCMKRTAKDKNILVQFSSYLYLLHPMLYFYTLQLKK